MKTPIRTLVRCSAIALASTLTLLTLASCANSSPPPSEQTTPTSDRVRLNSAEVELLWEHPTDPTQSFSKSVAVLLNETTGRVCSGVLVSEEWVTTSRDCFSDDASKLKVLFPEALSFAKDQRQVTEVQTSLENKTAFVRLNRPVANRAAIHSPSAAELTTENPAILWQAKQMSQSLILLEAVRCRLTFGTATLPTAVDASASRQVLTQCAGSPESAGAAVTQGNDLKAIAIEALIAPYRLSRAPRTLDVEIQAVLIENKNCLNEGPLSLGSGSCDRIAGRLRSDMTRDQLDTQEQAERLALSQDVRARRNRFIHRWESSAEPPQGLAYESIPVEAETLDRFGIEIQPGQHFFVAGPRCLTSDYLNIDTPAEQLEADRLVSRPYWLPIWALSTGLDENLQWKIRVIQMDRLEARLDFYPELARSGRRVPMTLMAKPSSGSSSDSQEEQPLIWRIVDECGS